MSRWAIAPTAVFALFILWIIYMADSGDSTIFFDLVKATPYGDKIGHVVLYGLLALGANLSTGCKALRVGNFAIYAGSAAVGIFAVAEELTQCFLPGRTFDLFDVLADGVGILLFSLVSHFLSRRA